MQVHAAVSPILQERGSSQQNLEKILSTSQHQRLGRRRNDLLVIGILVFKKAACETQIIHRKSDECAIYLQLQFSIAFDQLQQALHRLAGNEHPNR